MILHGDAAFPGQGVVAEQLNLQGLDGYTVGGTLHLIQNNQVGFTTDPDDSRSTRWASDLAKGFDVPIIHVNADDVSACVAAVRLAFAFRQEFGHDVLIDLIGYRRFGHNEADEPAYTQPEMAAKIKQKTSARDLYAERLVEQGVVTQEEAEGVAQEIWENLAQRHRELKAELAASDEEQPTGGYELDRSPSPEVKTAVSNDRLLGLNEDLLRIPEGFTVHPKLVKQLERRRETVGPDGGIDWAQAESLAFASLLSEGTPIRLTGQDTERGTFSQRHLVLHDAKTGQRISPIQNLPGALAPMELHNSPLSEVACLGFEYGYSMEAPETLVLWEAQFGDFVNSAQVIIDQFIVSALSKWGQSTRLTLLLPHGYEGSGPEHSSGRLERFLQLAAEGNIRVANLTTPAQYFHLLRRQARVAKQRPLVIMTPKSLLRLPQATSRIEHLADSRFFPVLSEPRIDEEKVTRLVLCSGKIYYDLKGHATRENNETRRDHARRAALSVPAAPDHGRGRALPEPARGRVGAGGAAQHGRTHAHVAAAAADPAAEPRVRLRRPAGARLAGRGLPGRAHDGADADHPHRARPGRAGVGQSDQAAGRALARNVACERNMPNAMRGTDSPGGVTSPKRVRGTSYSPGRRNRFTENSAPCGSRSPATLTRALVVGRNDNRAAESHGALGDRVGVVDGERHAPARRRVAGRRHEPRDRVREARGHAGLRMPRARARGRARPAGPRTRGGATSACPRPSSCDSQPNTAP